jgi:BASS family bile acid:Na+ symporter
MVLLLLVLTATVRNADLFATIAPSMYAASILLGVLGMVLGDLAARFARLPTPQRRAVSLETGIQNSPLAFAIIAVSFQGEQQAEMLKLPMLYALFVLIEASLVTLFYRARDRASSDAQSVAPVPSLGKLDT